MAAKKGTKRERLSTKKPRRRAGRSPASGARRLLTSAQSTSGGSTPTSEIYSPSPAPDDGQTAAGILAFYATADMLELPPDTDPTKAASRTAQNRVPWPEWVSKLLAKKLEERLTSVKEDKPRNNVANAKARVEKWN
ncbi:MAG TPA: hypothetical protein VLS93_08985 [Anaeromyxobacteraceae bacterium]|nr:hypothetical protein [Anaeromyxobacteraceae bacterium]